MLGNTELMPAPSAEELSKTFTVVPDLFRYHGYVILVAFENLNAGRRSKRDDFGFKSLSVESGLDAGCHPVGRAHQCQIRHMRIPCCYSRNRMSKQTRDR